MRKHVATYEEQETLVGYCPTLRRSMRYGNSSVTKVELEGQFRAVSSTDKAPRSSRVPGSCLH